MSFGEIPVIYLVALLVFNRRKTLQLSVLQPKKFTVQISKLHYCNIPNS